jgi:hypothetical protein
MRNPISVSTLLLLLALRCSGSDPLSPGELTALTRAEAQWKARPFADYSYEIMQTCFCPPESGRWTRVTVRQNLVVAAEAIEPDPMFPTDRLTYWQPIDSLLARLRHAVNDKTVREVYSDIVVEYDAALGYPTRIEWISKPNIQDAGVVYSLRNVRALPITTAPAATVAHSPPR